MRRNLAVLTLGRFTVNLALRFVYPFLPQISRGLGVSLGAVGIGLSIRELVGLVGPRIGRVIDRGRHRRGMALGLVAVAIGVAVGGVSPGVVVFTAAMVIVGGGQLTYNTAMSTWVSERVPYEQRGTALGVTELAWAGALLVGVPLVGLTIDWWGWRSPFAWVALVNLAMGAVIAVAIAPDRHEHGARRERLVLTRAAVGVYACLGLLSLGLQSVFIVYGAWFEDAFGLGVAAVGLASILVGASELLGSGSTVFLTDRLGKVRSILIGSLVMMPGGALLGVVDDNTALGIALLATILFGFEFAFVSAQPLVTEVAPSSRAASLGLSYAAVTVGRAIGSGAGPWLYTEAGIGAVGWVAVVTVAIGVVALIALVREPQSSGPRALP